VGRDPKPPLDEISWDDVETLNQFICGSQGHQIGRTSDGYEPAKIAWEQGKGQASTLEEAAELCRRCHRLAPFLFLNGNTFVAIARDALTANFSHLPYAQQVVARGAIGHFIAGTIGADEMKNALEAVRASESSGLG
jgi:hypothetical protein